MSKLSNQKVIAITGSMGSGKSKVSELLSQTYPVIDCDRINEVLLKKGNEGYEELIKKPYIQLLENGEIDKVAMSQCMFTDFSIKKEVEQILHPLIFSKIDEWVSQQESFCVFVEVPLLFEIHAQSHFDAVWCVVCDEDIALERLQKYRHVSCEEAKRRLNTQMSVEEKKSKSDVILLNNGSIEELKKQIQIELERLETAC